MLFSSFLSPIGAPHVSATTLSNVRDIGWTLAPQDTLRIASTFAMTTRFVNGTLSRRRLTAVCSMRIATPPLVVRHVQLGKGLAQMDM